MIFLFVFFLKFSDTEFLIKYILRRFELSTGRRENRSYDVSRLLYVRGVRFSEKILFIL